MCEEEVVDLQPSKLGTKEYWDDFYENEIKNYSSHGDVGEVWFGEDSEFRILRWLKSSTIVSPNDTVIDLGCGNGMMLVELAREGFTHLVGVDYSEAAINLAKSVASSHGYDFIQFKVCDIIEGDSSLCEFNVALDKGTYDAISLNPNEAKDKRMLYKTNVVNMLKPNGLLIITSCNWTDQELIQDFGTHFDLETVIPTPKFHFSGKVGSLVSSIVFRRKSQKCS